MRRSAVWMLLIAIVGCRAADPNPRKEDPLTPRMKNPAMIIPEAMQAILALKDAVDKGGLPQKTLDLVHLRVSQINGCHACIDGGMRHAAKAGESEARLCAIPQWRDVACFTDAERAALRLAEAVTRLSDRSDPVPDEVWNEAAKFYDERGLATLLLSISITNVFNRLNVATRQQPGRW